MTGWRHIRDIQNCSCSILILMKSSSKRPESTGEDTNPAHLHPEEEEEAAGCSHHHRGLQQSLKSVLPKFHQHVKCPIRGGNTLDHIYSNIKRPYRATPQDLNTQSLSPLTSGAQRRDTSRSFQTGSPGCLVKSRLWSELITRLSGWGTELSTAPPEPTWRGASNRPRTRKK